MKTTMCRWCGGEMVIKFSFVCNSVTLSYWLCKNCYSHSGEFEGFSEVEAESAALAWAEQPIPFIPEKKYTQDDYIAELTWELSENLGHNQLIDDITSALGVKTTEQ